MKHAHILTRVMSLVLVLVLALSLVTPSFATSGSNTTGENDGITWTKVDNIPLSAFINEVTDDEAQIPYADTDMVRVSIVLKDASTLDRGFSAYDIASGNRRAMRYRAELAVKQDKMAANISKTALDGEALDVVWNLTLAANIISANVEYGQIAEIEKVKGVDSVILENRYAPCVTSDAETADPNMATSSSMIGSDIAWADGYTGAGSKIAIIDTGADTDHPSLDGSAYSYAVKDSGITPFTAADTEAVLKNLHAYTVMEGNLTAEQLYVDAKIPFAFNYVDHDLDVSHDHDYNGDHGSHVTGIAAANRYIRNDDGSFSPALDTVLTQGVAPDAQVVVMKVFGKNGGAYDTDYMAALEDAMVLGCDSANLSLGSGMVGFSHSNLYEQLLQKITESGMTVAISAGNSGNWFENTAYGLPYAESVSWSTTTSPSTFTNALSVASVENVGYTGEYLVAAGRKMFYHDSNEKNGSYWSNHLLATIPGDYEYVYIDSIGTAEEFAAMKDLIANKIAICNRGDLNFSDKATNAASNGAIATIIANNVAGGTVSMDLSMYAYSQPCVSISLDDANYIKANSEKHTADSGLVYYTGSLTVSSNSAVSDNRADHYTMSDFSSWGVPSSLELKPEITAPGGSIYSLKNGGSFQNMSGTSMAAPQIAGMAAVLSQYIRANGLEKKTGLSARHLTQSLLMSTAAPLRTEDGTYYPVFQQGAGLANVGKALSAKTYILMDDDANKGASDGKIKVELGDDPQRTGTYDFGFTIYNTGDSTAYFNLNADFFTQDVQLTKLPADPNASYAYADEAMLETKDTVDLSSDVTWIADGKEIKAPAPENLANCDFNGDGKVTKDDGQALLDYVTGVRTEISNEQYADLSGDGTISTRDAYLFFQQMNQSLVEIPAGSSVHVSASAKVFGLDKYDKASDNTGTYVEGYVYADALSSDEGELGDSHSIPVLGYYGSWSEPSMYDIGSFTQYLGHTETRAPYMYAQAGQNAMNLQAISVRYEGSYSGYMLGSNPYLNEGFYDPDRVSINTDTTTLSTYRFTSIRTAAAGYVTVTDEDGTEYGRYTLGNINPAYYDANNSCWSNTAANMPMGRAYMVPEGKTLSVQLALAPEYYVTGYNEDGTAQIDWEALDDGAYQTTKIYVDKTAPEITNVSLLEDMESGEKSLVITAKDDRYVAASFLLDNFGRIRNRVAGSPEGAARGSEAVMTLPINISSDHILVQVADYADNTATYQINFNKEELNQPVEVTLDKTSTLVYVDGSTKITATLTPFGTHPDTITWTSDNEDVATVTEKGVVTGHAPGEATIRATSVKDPTKYAECKVTVKKVDAVLYGVLQDSEGNPQIFTWDMAKEKTWSKVIDVEHPLTSAVMDPVKHRIFATGEQGDYHVYEIDPATGKTLNTYEPAVKAIYDDMTYSYVFSTEETSVFSAFTLYQINLPFTMDDQKTLAWNFFSKIYNATHASKFVAITSAGATKVDVDKDGEKETDAEMFLLLDNMGYVWSVSMYKTESGWSYALGYTPSNLYSEYAITFPGYGRKSHCSMFLCEEENEPVIYLSAYNGVSTDIYRLILDENGAWCGAPIGNAGAGVHPVSLLSNQKVDGTLVEKISASATAVSESSAPQAAVSSSDISASETGSLNSVSNLAVFNDTAAKLEVEEPATASTVNVSSDEKTVTVDVLAKDAANNGLFSVNYDAASLTLNDVTFNTQYSSYKDADGKVTLGYVDLTGVSAGTAVASLTFTVNASAASDKVNLTVTEAERNDETVENVEALTADLHTETKVENAKDATCTEDGYTGDTVCAVCGKVLAKGEVIKALGHEYKDGKCIRCGAAAPKTPDVKTGDESSIALWIGVMVFAAALAVTAVLLLRKKRADKAR